MSCLFQADYKPNYPAIFMLAHHMKFTNQGLVTDSFRKDLNMHYKNKCRVYTIRETAVSKKADRNVM